jgi:hypothetical protein
MRAREELAVFKLVFVKDWLGHANIQNTTISAQLTNPARDRQDHNYL